MKIGFWLVALAAVAAGCAAQSPIESAQSPAEAGQMQARMQEMHALMERIHGTEDPAERQRLMAEHMRAMHDGMSMMGRMMGSDGGGPGRGAQCAQDDTECRMRRMQGEQQMMGERMGMMQTMMAQMMDHMMAAAPEDEGGVTPSEPGPERTEPQPPAKPEDHEAHH